MFIQKRLKQEEVICMKCKEKKIEENLWGIK